MNNFQFDFKRPLDYQGLGDKTSKIGWKKAVETIENEIFKNPYMDEVCVVFGDYPDTCGTRLSYEMYFDINSSIGSWLRIVYSVINNQIIVYDITIPKSK